MAKVVLCKSNHRYFVLECCNLSESPALLYTLDGYKVQTASLLEKLMTHHGNGLHSSSEPKGLDNKNRKVWVCGHEPINGIKQKYYCKSGVALMIKKILHNKNVKEILHDASEKFISRKVSESILYHLAVFKNRWSVNIKYCQ